MVSEGLKVVAVSLGQGTGSTCPNLPRAASILVLKVSIHRRQEVLIFGDGHRRVSEVQKAKAAQKTGAKSNTVSVKWILHGYFLFFR